MKIKGLFKSLAVISLSCQLSWAADLNEGITCGLVDKPPESLKSVHNNLAGQLDYSGALRQVMNYVFTPLPERGYDVDNFLYYLQVLYEDSLGVTVTPRELDLLLCTFLSESTITLYPNHSEAGLASFSPEQYYLFYLKLNILDGFMAHGWLLVHKQTGQVTLAALDD
ncbi:hypothetical protein H0A36_09660 [Endozoicomonas sp. SM1973]|uniref:Uncharacterized protein n=1 Tax=Spartinivicinus marinus TaxID=2994442 RepID=A0A853I9Q1_9GAMM|nr:hypothetical protein [Spartinivicinus marinus]MCX4024696.1 hypothetical protein [Spartinivicinus marinus]NYZ66277.1 hypothetical protein [Spartinivicinus marinus]